MSTWHLIWPQPTLQIHMPTHRPKHNTHSFMFFQLHAFVYNCFLFHWKLSFFPNKIWKKQKSLCLKIPFKGQSFVPIQEAFPQFLGFLLCMLTILYLYPVTQHSALLIIYALFPLSFIRSLKTGTMSFVQWPEKPIGGRVGRWRGDEERKMEKNEKRVGEHREGTCSVL